eukprot:6651738-Alexandrium_andersonii.AAC.1
MRTRRSSRWPGPIRDVGPQQCISANDPRSRFGMCGSEGTARSSTPSCSRCSTEGRWRPARS